MELIINRVKYECAFDDVKIIISSDPNELTYNFQWKNFIQKFENNNGLISWAKDKKVGDESYISYEFTKDENTPHFKAPLVSSLQWKYTWFAIGQNLIAQGFIVDFAPRAISISCYRKIQQHDNTWDLYQRIDFKLNYNDYKKSGEATFNFGSQNTLVSRAEIEILEKYKQVKIVNPMKRIIKSNYSELRKGRIIANRNILTEYNISFDRTTINYCKRYKDLLEFYNNYLKAKDFEGLKFISNGFDSLNAQNVSFQRNKMVFKNENKDINPVTGMRNYGVFKPAPNATETKFIFIFQHNDDANTLYKYLKNGYKGFPGLERYVDIPLVLADALSAGQEYKRLKFESLDSLMDEYQAFEKSELPETNYANHFALVISELNKDKPEQAYYDLKLALLSKGIPSQFINHQNIRSSAVFNYHLPNIAIGIHAKLGGIPWRIDSEKKNELVIGFNQDFTNDAAGKKRFIAGSVFFDNHGNLKRTFSFPEKDSSNEIIRELKNAVTSFLVENVQVERIVIHYHKSLSGGEKERIDTLLKNELKISVPYAVVEINDTKSRIELAFDPGYNFQMPISGSFVRLSKKEYLLFNNNRFKEVAPVGVKDELPLKIKIHFADESGFSHKELIEQVYEFSRLIWKGLKQRSQPATCFYAHEIARFKAHAKTPIPENRITQTTPWII
jgi:hypothetical protein